MNTGAIIIYSVLFVFQIVCLWIVFTKAGKPGWGCIIPIYNIVLLCDIAEISRWWTIGVFIPIVNVIVGIMLALGVARGFGRSLWFGLGLFLLPIIFYAILAFSDSSRSSQMRLQHR